MKRNLSNASCAKPRQRSNDGGLFSKSYTKRQKKERLMGFLKFKDSCELLEAKDIGWSFDGAHLALCTSNVAIWERKGKSHKYRCIAMIHFPILGSSAVQHLSWSPKERKFAFFFSGAIRIFAPRKVNSSVVRKFDRLLRCLDSSSCHFQRDQSRLVNNIFKEHPELNAYELVASTKRFTSSISDLKWSPDGKSIATAGTWQWKVWVWKQHPIMKNKYYGATIRRSEQCGAKELAWSPDSKHLAIVGCSGVSIWEEIPLGKMDTVNAESYSDSSSDSSYSSFSSSSCHAFSSSCWVVFGTAKTYWKKVAHFREGNDRVPKHLSWSSDGVLAISFANAYVMLRRPLVSFMIVKQGHWESFVKISSRATIKISAISPILAWAPSGRLLAVSIHNRIVVYERQDQVGAGCSLVKVADLKPYNFPRRNQVQSVAWSADGFRLATAFADSVCIWPIIPSFTSASYQLSSGLGMEFVQLRQFQPRKDCNWAHLTVKIAWSADHRLAVVQNRKFEWENAWVYHRRDDLSARNLLHESLSPNLPTKLILIVEDFTFDLQ